MKESHESAAELVAVVALIALGLFVTVGPLVQVARSDGQIDYCYVHATAVAGQGYEVVGHRPWRADASIGYAPTPEAANRLLLESAACGKR